MTSQTIPWEEAQRVCDLERIDDMICNLIADPTNDNAVCLVREIMYEARKESHDT